MASKGMEELPGDLRKISQLHAAFRRLNQRVMALENMRIFVDMEQQGIGDLSVGGTSCECRITAGKETGNLL